MVGTGRKPVIPGAYAGCAQDAASAESFLGQIGRTAASHCQPSSNGAAFLPRLYSDRIPAAPFEEGYLALANRRECRQLLDPSRSARPAARYHGSPVLGEFLAC